MVSPQIIAYIVLALLFFYQLWVSMLVYRADGYDAKQRYLQCLAIWLIPLLAALTCHLILHSSRGTIKPANTSFVNQSENIDTAYYSSGSATD